MFRTLTNLFIFFCCLYHYSFCDCFYIFDVGQGNCQLAVFEDEKIGVLYDCGSSSSKEHVKISALKGEDFISFLILKPIVSEINKYKFEGTTGINKISGKRVNGNRMSRSCNIQKNFPKETDIEETNKKVHEEMGSYIRSVIVSHNLEYLFIILSHPDEDHINLIPHALKNLKTLPVMVICGGNWLNHVTRDVWSVLDFLSKNETIQVRFPFYPTKVGNNVLNIFKNTKYKNKDKNKIKNEINEILTKNKGKNTALKCENLYKFVEKERKIWTEEEKRVLENTKIAHINYLFKDVNSQSTIVEIKMEELKTQFLLTGDAEYETFEQIKNVDKDFFKKDKGYISLVMLLHHGSVKNFFKGKKLMENEPNLFDFFNPDIIGVSAGNGDSHKNRHPDKELVDWITKQKYNGKVLLKNSFESMIMYQKGESDDGFLFENGPEKMPFICTNLLGDIKISKDESSENLVFSAKFSNIFKDKDGVSYEIDYSKHVNTPKPSNAKHEDKSIQETSKNECYFRVPKRENKKRDIETEYLCYYAIKLENNASTVADIKEQ